MPRLNVLKTGTRAHSAFCQSSNSGLHRYLGTDHGDRYRSNTAQPTTPIRCTQCRMALVRVALLLTSISDSQATSFILRMAPFLTPTYSPFPPWLVLLMAPCQCISVEPVLRPYRQVPSFSAWSRLKEASGRLEALTILKVFSRIVSSGSPQ